LIWNIKCNISSFTSENINLTILRLIKFNFPSKITVVPNQEREQLEQQEQLQLQQQEQQQNLAADGQTINRHGCKTDIRSKKHN
jgi:hypothetical protein